ncbi:MAG: hypothetical protein IPJ51_08665 [Saprospiraceae bacterium]|nr:hypothetical protein [Saprospiraceae bacterium]
MDRLKFLLATFVVGVLTLGIYSCAKDSEENKQGLNEVSIRTRSFDDSGKLFSFTSLSNSQQNDGFMIIANKLSLLMKNDAVFKEKILSSFQDVNYNEVLLSELFLKTSNSDIYNSLKSELNSNSSDSNLNLDQFLANNPLLAISFPYVLVDKIPLAEAELAVIVRSDLDKKTYFFFDNEVTTQDTLSEFEYAGILLKESEEHYLYDMANDEFKHNGNSFKEEMYIDLNDCNDLYIYLNTQPKVGNYTKLNIQDIQQKYSSMCFEVVPPIVDYNDDVTLYIPTGPSGGPNGGPLGDIDCDRGAIEVDLLYPEKTRNENYFTGFKLESYTVFQGLDNQPCDLEEQNGRKFWHKGQNNFHFLFSWIMGRNGAIAGTRTFRFDVKRRNLVVEQLELERRWFRWRWKIVSGQPVNVRVSTPIFGSSVASNHWTVDNQGDLFYINVQEFDTQICVSTSTQTTTTNVELGGKIDFGKILKEPLSFKVTGSATNTQVLQITGPSTQNLGNTFFEYCTPYERNWFHRASTGAAELTIWSPWY